MEETSGMALRVSRQCTCARNVSSRQTTHLIDPASRTGFSCLGAVDAPSAQEAGFIQVIEHFSSYLTGLYFEFSAVQSALWFHFLAGWADFRSKNILVSEPSLTDLEEKYLLQAYRSTFISGGAGKFKKRLETEVSTKYNITPSALLSVPSESATGVNRAGVALISWVMWQFASMCGCRFGVATANGTVAINLALIAA
eukprot:2130646-Rhodomonas_salina.1